MKPRTVPTHSFALTVALLSVLLAATAALGQSTSFTYQGRLTDGGSAATGNYDFQFALWDSASGGAQIGSTLTLSTVGVSNGIFTVSLDFGAASFNGASRFLEISARPVSAGTYTLLSPRQPVAAIPYAIRSLNAATADTATIATTATNANQLGGVTASQYVQTNDARLSDPRVPTAGSANYIQSNPAGAQSSNFNISGNGTVGGTLSGNAVNSGSVYQIGGTTALSLNGHLNTFAGTDAGKSNSGTANSFFGNAAGTANTSGSDNSFFGAGAGSRNLGGGENVFLGESAGINNMSGNRNTFVGNASGQSNLHGFSNTALGYSANVDNSDLSFATAIGAGAIVKQSNSLVLGSISGANPVSSAAPDTNVGIGTATPRSALEVNRNWDGSFGAITVTGDRPTIRFSGGAPTNNDQWILHLGSAAGAAPAGSLSFFFGGSAGTSFGSPVLSVTPNSTVVVGNLGAAGSTQLCRNGSSEISTCSSSLRYKQNVITFHGGLEVINRLRPISFTWKQDGTSDVGFGAEEVEKVAPLFAFRNDHGEIEGVRYERLSVLFVNAFKEQQQQIEEQRKELTLRQQEAARQQKLIEQQQAVLTEQKREVSALKKLVCHSHRQAAVCK